MAHITQTVVWVADSKDEYFAFKEWWTKRAPDGMTVEDDDGSLTITLSKSDPDWKVPLDEPR